MAEVFDCEIIISESEPHLHYKVPFQTKTFGKGWNFHIHISQVLNSTYVPTLPIAQDVTQSQFFSRV